VLVLLLLSGGLACAQTAGEEILYPSKEYSKLDTFEALNLEDADKLYGKKDFNGAYAAYKAFSFEFAKSKAQSYVLLRMGRCLHLLDKRNAAVKAYQDVVDYFPDDVRYAAAALYYIGECHGQNGDENQKLAVWARMVKDDGYVGQPQSGTALAYLGQAMEKLGRFDEAAEYHWRTAVSFQKSNPQAAQVARQAVLAHYVARRPNHEKLKEFFTSTSGFDSRGGNVDKPEDDMRYWQAVLSRALESGGKPEDRQAACRYWTGKMGDRFAGADGLRKLWIDAMLVHEQDRSKWLARMDKQFAQQPASLDRIMQWCGYYQDSPKQRAEFFAKQAAGFLAGMKFKDKMRLLDQLRRLRMDDEAMSLLRSVSVQGLSDDEIRELAFTASNYWDADQTAGVLSRIKDAGFAAKARFDYFLERSARNRPYQERALAEIPLLKKEPKYAGPGLVWEEARLLHQLGRLEEAIKAYQAANRQPDSTWGVTDCLIALKQYGQAIKNVQGLESVGGGVAAQAGLKVADIYRLSNEKGKEVDQLRLVLRRYPKSRESSEAHERLEKYGVKIMGGEAKAEE
jgi:tetratricopeptide (TPR) repeat protein